MTLEKNIHLHKSHMMDGDFYLMAKLFTDFILTTYIAKIYNKLYNTTSKLHKSASSLGFIKKALHHKVTPKFAQISGQFINKQDQIDAD